MFSAVVAVGFGKKGHFLKESISPKKTSLFFATFSAERADSQRQSVFLIMFVSPADDDFAATLNEGTEKIVLHGSTMTRLLLEKGEVRMLTYVLSSMVLARNRLAYYSTEVLAPDGKDPFKKSKADLEDLIGAMVTQVRNALAIKSCHIWESFFSDRGELHFDGHDCGCPRRREPGLEVIQALL